LLKAALELRSRCPSLEHVVIVDGPADATPLISFEQLQTLCPAGFEVQATAARVGPEDLCSLVYTSGTTGAPKGVPYLHRCLMTTMHSIHGHVPVSPEGRVISYLPMAHIAERMFGHYAGFVFGYDITSLRDASRLGEALRAVRPTRFFGVPRIWEKLLAGVYRALSETIDPERANAMRAALERGIARVRADQPGELLSPELEAAARPDAELLAGILAMLGLDRAEWLGVAGAPAGAETLEAFHALGLPVNELYGMSETITICTSPRPGSGSARAACRSRASRFASPTTARSSSAVSPSCRATSTIRSGPPRCSRTMRDRPPRLEHQPATTLQQLLRILPRSCHEPRLLPLPGEPWPRSLRRTHDGSRIAFRAMQVARFVVVVRGSRRRAEAGVRIDDPEQVFSIRPPTEAFADQQSSFVLFVDRGH
jgi:acyl-CoA synthetase (AMP-forming)/AMP-acid ligase II